MTELIMQKYESAVTIMQYYNFYEFNGFQLLEVLQKSDDNTINLSSWLKRNLGSDIYTVETHSDTALFYQAKLCLMEMRESAVNDYSPGNSAGWDEDFLKYSLIYIDFSEVFPLEKYAKRKYKWSEKTDEDQRARQINKCRTLAEKVFANGFYINHEGPGLIHYVPFEKSQSMARKGSMLFIDKQMYTGMEQRLRLGLDFCGVEIRPSKLYAYTGLYLSNSVRVTETENLCFNEETVIVLPDNEERNLKIDGGAITGTNPKKEEGGLRSWVIEYIKDYKAIVNFFDGEGLISPEYGTLINHILKQKYGKSGTATSFQIRMPYTKGMLHMVDFRKFICERFGIDSCKDVLIEDAFGKKRNIGKVQIILTQSMFKVFNSIRNEKISGLKAEDDHMQLYFDRFHKYDHAFYVGMTDTNLTQSGKTKLSYQFLNTLALTEEELKELASEQVKLAKSFIETDFVRESNPDFENENSSGSFDDFLDNAIYSNNTWYEVAMRKPAFLNDRKVIGKIKGIQYKLLKDVGYGRLTVSGGTKILSRDLLALLSYIISRIDSGSCVSAEQKEKIRAELDKEKLRSNKFFAADCVPNNPCFRSDFKRLQLNYKAYYSLFRSPHLSRNEQCSLNPYRPGDNDIYTRYFSHLRGILMVPQYSFAPEILGGADFDGDLVKIITDKRVNRAVNNACYYPDTKKSGRKHLRRLPVVVIPNTSPRKITLANEKVDFQTLNDTFSSRVGEISNLAIYLGEREYDGKESSSEYALKCETCTILTGLEIDAAKTGEHPYLKDILKDRESCYFLKRKKEIDKLPKEYYLFKIQELPAKEKTKDIKRHRLAAVGVTWPQKGKELMTADFMEEYDDYFKLDCLPFIFLKEFSCLSDIPVIEQKPDDVKFSFEKDPNWRKQVQDKEKRSIIKDLIYAYKGIHDLEKKSAEMQDKICDSNFSGCINYILQVQYTGLMDYSKILDLQDETFTELFACLNSYEAAEAALKKLVLDQRWQYFDNKEDKDWYLDSILFQNCAGCLSDQTRAVLENFRWYGYYLLYYYIKAVMSFYCESDLTLSLLNMEEQIVSNSRYLSGEYYDELKNIYMNALKKRESRTIWKRKIIRRCREILCREFENRVDMAIMYTHAMRSIDPYGKFFWDIFTANEILMKTEAFLHA